MVFLINLRRYRLPISFSALTVVPRIGIRLELFVFPAKEDKDPLPHLYFVLKQSTMTMLANFKPVKKV